MGLIPLIQNLKSKIVPEQGFRSGTKWLLLSRYPAFSKLLFWKPVKQIACHAVSFRQALNREWGSYLVPVPKVKEG